MAQMKQTEVNEKTEDVDMTEWSEYVARPAVKALYFGTQTSIDGVDVTGSYAVQLPSGKFAAVPEQLFLAIFAPAPKL